MMSDAIQLARNTIKQRVRRWFTQLRADHPGEHFYAVAFGFHDDFVGPSLNANSLESRSAADEPGSSEITWNDSMWPYSEAYHDAWNVIPAPVAQDDSNELGASGLQYRAQCIRVTIDALRELGNESLWGSAVSQVLVYLSMWDGFERQWLMHESARRIQPSGLDPAYPLLHVEKYDQPPFLFNDKLFSKYLKKHRGSLAAAYYQLIGEVLE